MVFVKNICALILLLLTLVSLGSCEIQDFTLKSYFTNQIKKQNKRSTEYSNEENKLDVARVSLLSIPVGPIRFHKETERKVKTKDKRCILKKKNEENDFDYSGQVSKKQIKRDDEFSNKENNIDAAIGPTAPMSVGPMRLHEEETERTIKTRRKRDTFEKGNEDNDFEYGDGGAVDDYKDTLYVFPNSSFKVFNTSITVKSTDIPEYEEYPNNRRVENFEPFLLSVENKNTSIKTRITATPPTGKLLRAPEVTDSKPKPDGPGSTTTPQPGTSRNDTTNITEVEDDSNDYNEKDTDFYIRHFFRKDYLFTVAFPQAIGITIFLLILFALLYTPACCYGFLYKPPDEAISLTTAVSLAREESCHEHLDEG